MSESEEDSKELEKHLKKVVPAWPYMKVSPYLVPIPMTEKEYYDLYRLVNDELKRL